MTRGTPAVRQTMPCAGRSIGDVLVDQRVVAGIGNIYRCETLFLRASLLSPLWGLSDDEVASTLAIARTLMMRNRNRSSQATTGDERALRLWKTPEHMPALRHAHSLSTRSGTAAP